MGRRDTSEVTKNSKGIAASDVCTKRNATCKTGRRTWCGHKMWVSVDSRVNSFVNDLEQLMTHSQVHRCHQIERVIWYAWRQVCHPEGSRWAGGMGRQEPYEIQQGQIAKSCTWGGRVPCSDTGWWLKGLKKSPWWSWQTASWTGVSSSLAAKAAACLLSCVNRSRATGLREVIIPNLFGAR